MLKSNGKPKLDKWDSQILLISKGHFPEFKEKYHINNMDLLRALWSDRCGLEMKYVRLGPILAHMIDMLADLNLLTPKEVRNLLSEAIDYNSGSFPKYHDYKLPMVDTLIQSVLGTLSCVQVKDHITVDGETIWEDLLEMEEKYCSFLEVFEENK